MYPMRIAAQAALEQSDEILTRFWQQVDFNLFEDQCWLWRGRYHGNGSPVLYVAPRYIDAGLIAFFAVVGEIPPAGRVDHCCGDPRCVRPTHLQLTASPRSQTRLADLHDGYVLPIYIPTLAQERHAVLRALDLVTHGSWRAVS